MTLTGIALVHDETKASSLAIADLVSAMWIFVRDVANCSAAPTGGTASRFIASAIRKD